MLKHLAVTKNYEHIKQSLLISQAYINEIALKGELNKPLMRKILCDFSCILQYINPCYQTPKICKICIEHNIANIAYIKNINCILYIYGIIGKNEILILQYISIDLKNEFMRLIASIDFRAEFDKLHKRLDNLTAKNISNDSSYDISESTVTKSKSTSSEKLDASEKLDTSENSTESVFTMLARSPMRLQYCKNQTKEIAQFAVKNYGLALKYVTCQDEDICFSAITQNLSALDFVDNMTNKLFEYIKTKDVNIFMIMHYNLSGSEVIKKSKVFICDRFNGDTFKANYSIGNHNEFCSKYLSLCNINIVNPSKYTHYVNICMQIKALNVMVAKKSTMANILSAMKPPNIDAKEERIVLRQDNDIYAIQVAC
jgi:hypothetical protein